MAFGSKDLIQPLPTIQQNTHIFNIEKNQTQAITKLKLSNFFSESWIHLH